MRFYFWALAVAAALVAWPARAEISGDWTNPSKSVVIHIGPCGHTLCGTVSWASQKAKRDAMKGTKHLVGSHLLTKMQKSNSSWKGKLFIPDQNMNVSAKLKLVSANELKVSGCALMICKSQIWTRMNRQGHG
jgi:uncharacterized protein (DUF2147 family)